MIERILIKALEDSSDRNVYALEKKYAGYTMAIDCKLVAHLVLNAFAEAEKTCNGLELEGLNELLMQMQVYKDFREYVCWWPCSHETWIELPIKENA